MGLVRVKRVKGLRVNLIDKDRVRDRGWQLGLLGLLRARGATFHHNLSG